MVIKTLERVSKNYYYIIRGRKAREFLLDILANGGMPQKKIAEEAEGQGIKKKTLWNAKKELEIDSIKRGKEWYWMLSE